MGKPTGFLEYKRKNNREERPEERIQHYNEFHQPLPERERREQASRCTDCGVPFCQAGMDFDGGTVGCPLNNLIPEWNDFLYRGNYQQAFHRLMKTSNFPEFTSRVCPGLCEEACTGNLYKGAVTVRDNELAIIEWGYANGKMDPHPPTVRTGKKVVVVGSGPAGLAVADQLNRRGHSVTVLEKEDRIGGLLMYGIPNMKLEKWVIDRRRVRMEADGVEFLTGVCVGKDVTPKQLEEQYDAVILACGAPVPRDLPIPGREGKEIGFAVPYLTASTKSLLDGIKLDPFMNAKGKRVLVIGGGDTANDCIGTAVRQGAKKITQFLRREEEPLTRAADNPWPEPPVVRKDGYGQQECVAVYGKDPRSYATRVKEFVLDEGGKVKAAIGIKLERVIDEATGKKITRDIEGSEFEVKCDMVLIAAGFTGADSALAESFGLHTDKKGNVPGTCPASHKTAVPHVFVAGDMRRGASLVVWAIREGRETAREVDTYLMGYSNLA